MTLTSADRIACLIEAGIEPDVAERIVRETNAAIAAGGSGVIPPDEAAELAEITPEDIERAKRQLERQLKGITLPDQV